MYLDVHTGIYTHLQISAWLFVTYWCKCESVPWPLWHYLAKYFLYLWLSWVSSNQTKFQHLFRRFHSPLKWRLKNWGRSNLAFQIHFMAPSSQVSLIFPYQDFFFFLVVACILKCMCSLVMPLLEKFLHDVCCHVRFCFNSSNLCSFCNPWTVLHLRMSWNRHCVT